MDPEIIKAASTSPLGIIALMILVISAVSLTFFRDAPHRMGLVVFALLFLGAGTFSATVIHKADQDTPTRYERIVPYHTQAPSPLSDIPKSSLPMARVEKVEKKGRT